MFYASTVSLQDLERNPAALLDRVEAGEHLIVSRDGKAVAGETPVRLLTPASAHGPRPFGLAAGDFVVPDDFGLAAPRCDRLLRSRSPAGVTIGKTVGVPSASLFVRRAHLIFDSFI